MSQKEAQRLAVIGKVLDGELGQAQAAAALGLSVRQVKRLVRRVRNEGASGADLQAPGSAQQPAHRCFSARTLHGHHARAL